MKLFSLAIMAFAALVLMTPTQGQAISFSPLEIKVADKFCNGNASTFKNGCRIYTYYRIDRHANADRAMNFARKGALHLGMARDILKTVKRTATYSPPSNTRSRRTTP